MMADVGASGGFVVPPDYVAELIEVLRPMAMVRDSGPLVLAMPRGTMQMPRQNQAATASYGGETQAIPVSQQAVGQIVATYKELIVLTPVTNDLLRYSDPNGDAIVRDDLAQVIARRRTSPSCAVTAWRSAGRASPLTLNPRSQGLPGPPPLP
jgi:HK97 family phage major capsid protein